MGIARLAVGSSIQWQGVVHALIVCVQIYIAQKRPDLAPLITPMLAVLAGALGVGMQDKSTITPPNA